MKINDKVMAPSPFFGEPYNVEGIIKGVREKEVDIEFTHKEHGTFTFNCKKEKIVEKSSK
jgi:hypothetical protein